jgi:hypothetical protein
MARRHYSDVAPPIPLTVDLAIGATSASVSSTAGYPVPPFTIAFERGTPNEELALCQAISDTSFDNLIRGYDGTTARAHLAATSVEHSVGGIDYDEANSFVNILSTKGDLLVYSTQPVRLPVGTGFLKGNPAVGEGMSWMFPTAAEVGALALAARAAINGVASLDGAGLIPIAQLPHDSSSLIQIQAHASSASASVSGADLTQYSFTSTLPAGWGSMDLFLIGYVSINYVNGSGFRRVISEVRVNGTSQPSNAGSEYYDNDWGGTNLGRTIPLANSLLGATANVTSSVHTSLTSGSGFVTTVGCAIHAIKLRRS